MYETNVVILLKLPYSEMRRSNEKEFRIMKIQKTYPLIGEKVHLEVVWSL